MDITNVFLLPSHGHEPYLLGVKLALRLGATCICLPDYYGHTQHMIMREEFPGVQDRIFLSPELGNLFRPLLLDAANPRNFVQHAQEVASPTHPRGALHIQKQLEKALARGLITRSLDDQRQVTFSSGDFTLALNLCLPLKTVIHPTFFVYTAHMSHLFSRAPTPQSRSLIPKIQELADSWADVEAHFSGLFIPRVNALSHTETDDPEVIFTPPLTQPLPPLQKKLEKPAVLIVPSGTGLDLEKLQRVSRTVPSGEYQRVTFRHSAEALGIRRGVDHTIYADPELVAVFSRGGWGTTWKCLAHLKPMGAVVSHPEEDLEIAHTMKTIEKLGTGVRIKNSATELLTPPRLKAAQKALRQLMASTEEEFGSYARDGIGFVAAHIRQSMNGKSDPRAEVHPASPKPL